ncbi:helix-turn-helix domain-containing protein, partial [Salipiger pacificus]|nr:helix-turn-helix domain-containing protein [Alloyangia pacifica]MCA0948572.1 helix-turn-helix domain-containing protein [Alloyangia pacifica]
MDRCYLQLSFEERIKIAKWREAKMPIPEIADRLSRAPSTIYRDLKRNHFDGGDLPELAGYYALNAQTMSEKRRAGLPTSPRASQTPQTAGLPPVPAQPHLGRANPFKQTGLPRR